MEEISFHAGDSFCVEVDAILNLDMEYQLRFFLSESCKLFYFLATHSLKSILVAIKVN
jgi:hypothetical protein